MNSVVFKISSVPALLT